MVGDIMGQDGVAVVLRLMVGIGLLWAVSRPSVRRSLSSWLWGRRHG